MTTPERRYSRGRNVRVMIYRPPLRCVVCCVLCCVVVYCVGLCSVMMCCVFENCTKYWLQHVVLTVPWLCHGGTDCTVTVVQLVVLYSTVLLTMHSLQLPCAHLSDIYSDHIIHYSLYNYLHKLCTKNRVSYTHIYIYIVNYILEKYRNSRRIDNIWHLVWLNIF